MLIVANCATHPHDPTNTERIAPFGDQIPYDWPFATNSRPSQSAAASAGTRPAPAKVGPPRPRPNVRSSAPRSRPLQR